MLNIFLEILDAHREKNHLNQMDGVNEAVWIDIHSVEKAMHSSPDSKWKFSKNYGVGSYREFVQIAEESVDEQELRNTASFSRWIASSGGGGRMALESQEKEVAVRRKWVDGHKRQLKEIESGAFKRQCVGMRSSSRDVVDDDALPSGCASSALLLKQISNEGRQIYKDAMAVKYAEK